MTRIFFDTEFTGLRQDTSLISIGLVSEDDKAFYAETTDYKMSLVDVWIQKNVVSKLHLISNNYSGLPTMEQRKELFTIQGTHEQVGIALKKWLAQFDMVEMWSDCLAYDWVLFNELFGGALHIPGNVYYIPFDICTLFKVSKIDPDVSREAFSGMLDGPKHDSLWDARVIRACYNKMMRP